jgi:hypothetical protein
LETMSGADLSKRGAVCLVVAQGFQCRVDLTAVRRYDPGVFASRPVIIGQHPGEQCAGRPPSLVAAVQSYPSDVSHPVDVDNDDLGVFCGMRPDRVAVVEQPVVGDGVGQGHDLRAKAVLDGEHGASRMPLRVARGRDAAMREDVRYQPLLDVRPVGLSHLLVVEDGTELHEVAEQRRRLRGA